MVFGLGPCATLVYESLGRSITGGELPPGTKLPAHIQLAQQFGVAPLTIRMVLRRLTERGTFMRARTGAAVVTLSGDEPLRAQLGGQIADAGYRAVTVAAPGEAVGAIGQDPTITLVPADMHLPDQQTGLTFVHAVRRCWPDLVLGVIIRSSEGVAGLHGTRESPVLLLATPFSAAQVAELLRLALPPRGTGGRGGGGQWRSPAVARRCRCAGHAADGVC